MQESGFVHSAFSFAHESMLSRTGLRSVDRSLPPGALITFLQKGLQYVGIEETMLQQQQLQEDGSPMDVSELADFSLLSPSTLSALSRPNPPIQLNVPPATAAAAIRAKLEAEAKLLPNSLGVAAHDTAALARQALAAQAAAQMATLQQQLILGNNFSNGQSSGVGTEPALSAAQQQRALDLLALQQVQQLPPQPLAEANLQLIGAAAAAAALSNSINNKRALTGGKRGPKKQKKTKNATSADGTAEASTSMADRRTSLGSSSARSEPEDGEEVDEDEEGMVEEQNERLKATQPLSPKHTKESLTATAQAAPTSMEIDDDNDEQPPLSESEPAHTGQQALPAPSSGVSSSGLVNGEKDRHPPLMPPTSPQSMVVKSLKWTLMWDPRRQGLGLLKQIPKMRQRQQRTKRFYSYKCTSQRYSCALGIPSLRL
jgi:hypothetical protein